MDTRPVRVRVLCHDKNYLQDLHARSESVVMLQFRIPKLQVRAPVYLLKIAIIVGSEIVGRDVLQLPH